MDEKDKLEKINEVNDLVKVEVRNKIDSCPYRNINTYSVYS